MAELAKRVEPMALIELAMQKGMMPDQLGKLLDLQERWERNEAAKAFADALTRFQARCPQVYKSRTAAFKKQDGTTGASYKFASLDDIDEIVRPILVDLGIVATFTTVAEKTTTQGLTMICRVRVGTHVEETEIRVAVPAEMRVNDTQKSGAALAYAKRYALCMALNVVVTDEDDDAAKLVRMAGSAKVEEVRKLLRRLPDWSEERVCKWLTMASLDELTVADYDKAKATLEAEIRTAIARNSQPKPQPTGGPRR